MTDLVQLIFSAGAQGMIYALLALAYNITFSTSKTLNFSVGSLLMVGGVAGFSVYVVKETGQIRGVPYWVPTLVVIILGFLLGWVIYKTSIEPAIKRKLALVTVLTTLAFSGILRNTVERVWGTDDVSFPSPFGDTPLRVLEAGIRPQEVFFIILILMIVFVLEWIKKRTVWGRVARAVAEDSETANLMGIEPKKVVIFSFTMSSALACLAGLLVAPVTLVSPAMGSVIGIKAYAVSIIGGLQSGWGAVAGGLILGLSEAFTARYLSTGYKDVTGFVILILIVLLRPNGLFGSGGGRKV
jgi:branched-chain amino acid transport system permease protein